jgi:transcriptional regulator GlxA family with amidase domain
MNLLDLYNLHQKGELSTDDMARMLGVSTKNLKIRFAKHGERLPLVLAVLDKINSDQID